MKKFLNTFMLALFVGLLFSCQNPTNANSNSTENSSENNENGEDLDFSEGWYLYTTNANSEKVQKTYFYINADGSIARAGSESNEYSGTQLELLQQQFSYSVCVKYADGITITFASSEAPSWADDSSTDVPTDSNSTEESSDDNTNKTVTITFSISYSSDESQNGKFEDENQPHKITGTGGAKIDYSDIPNVIPTSNDSQFWGWMDSNNNWLSYSNELNSYIFPDEDTIYYAYIREKEITYKITYHLNGGTVSVENPTSYTNYKNWIIITSPTQEGYVFNGWTEDSTEDFFSGLYNSNRDKGKITFYTQNRKGDIDLYAKWYKK